MSDNYIVVVEQTTEEYAGSRSWMTFSDQADFKKWYTTDNHPKSRIIGEGISEHDAIELCKERQDTSLLMHLRSRLELMANARYERTPTRHQPFLREPLE
jgi:hypothetical protein